LYPEWHPRWNPEEILDEDPKETLLLCSLPFFTVFFVFSFALFSPVCILNETLDQTLKKS
jgi:hypothetical protein